MVTLYATHKDAEYLYFILEPTLGGELFQSMHRQKLVGKRHLALRGQRAQHALLEAALDAVHSHARHALHGARQLQYHLRGQAHAAGSRRVRTYCLI